MAILSTVDLGHAYGATDLFHQVNLSLHARDRVALVGPNGSGKTTLLLVLAGMLEPTAGHVNRAAGLSLGYLRQEAVLTFAGQDNTIYEEMLAVFDELRRQEADLQAMESTMATDYSPDLLARYGAAQEAFELAGGYAYQTEIKRVLLGLGFSQAEWDTPLMHLSGGQKTRLLLGRLLLEKPDLLILDEPTNHLDMAAVEWLETTLRRWDGALILVSHDRYFLDRIASHIWAMETHRGGPAEIMSYRGNYSAYVRQRDEALERAVRLFVEEKERLAKEVEFIRKHIAGGQTDIAKGRLRHLSRDIALIDEIGLVQMAEMRRSNKTWLSTGSRVRAMSINEIEARINQLRAPDGRGPKLRIQLETLARSSRVVLRGKRVMIGYPDKPLVYVDEIKLQRGDRVAILGPNGSGKSTILKTITGEIDPLAGELSLGEGVQVGYFAQAHDQLIPERRVIDEIWARRTLSETEARRYLAGYLFRGDDVFKQVADLSGGERGRLALALLAIEGANFLLLDEPTNHLDIPSQEILQDVLQAFNGSILLVSHDRYLVDRLATHVWSIEAGELLVFPATYRDYLAQRDGQAVDEEQAGQDNDWQESEPLPTVPDAEPSLSIPASSGWDKQARRQDERRRREIEQSLEDAEYHLDRVSEAIELARQIEDENRIMELEAHYQTTRDLIEALLMEWELLS